MKRIPLEYAILGIAVAATFVVARPAGAQGTDSTADRIARGKYLVSTSACHDCHTPWVMGPKGPEPDMTRALSGHPENLVMPPAPKLQEPWMAVAGATMTAWSGPWGVSYTANLTPDPETGLGKWTARNFVETIRTGRHMGRGREVLPPMPIGVYRNFTDADLQAIFAYLQTLPPIRNRVPEPLPPAAAVAAK
jgi:mono/diheme cytochrome c family protein